MLKNVKTIVKKDKALAFPIFILLICLFVLNMLDVITTKLFLTFTSYLEANPLFQALTYESWLMPIIIKLFIIPFFLLFYLAYSYCSI
jgi:hypothetical protein